MASQGDIDQLIGMGFSKERAVAALNKKKTFQEALDMLLTEPDPSPPVAAPKASPKASYASAAGAPNAPQSLYPSPPATSPAPLPSMALDHNQPRDVPVARPGYSGFTSPRYQPISKEEEDYEKAIKQSLADTANRDASGEPLDPNDRKRQVGLPAGLKNIGNTCYFNSLVHIYNSLPQFRNMILRLPWREPSVIDPREVQMLLELQRLFAFLSCSPRKYLDPTTLVKILIDARGPGAQLGTQEDPTEFNLHILKLVRRGSKKLDPDTHAKISEYEYLILLFKGTQVQRVQSREKDGTPTEAITRESSGQVILDLRENRPQSIYTCLDDFTQPTHIEDYQTPKKHLAPATRFVTWESFPSVLFFQIQRAVYDREQKQLVKLSTPYTIETTIYLDRYLEVNFQEVLSRRNKSNALSEDIRKAELVIESIQNFRNSKQSLERVMQLSLEYLSDEVRKLDGPSLGAGKRRQQLASTVEIISAEVAVINDRLQSLQRSVETLKAQQENLFNDMRRNPYRLHAVLVHDGRSVGSGHYWAYLYERDSDRWILYNDQQTEEDVLLLKPPKARVDCQPTVYCLVYLSDKLVQGALGMKYLLTFCKPEPLPPSLAMMAEKDAAVFNEELARWNDAKAAGRNPDPVGQKVDNFKAKFFAKLESVIGDVSGKNALPDGRLRSFPHYLYSMDSQDLLQYELALEVWRELHPEASWTNRAGEYPRRLEESLDQVPWRLSMQQDSQLRELRGDFKSVVQMADWIAAGLNLLIQERWFDAVVYLLHTYKRERSGRKKFPELAEWTRMCLLGVARTLWSQMEAGNDYHSTLDQGWKLAALVIDDFPRADPLVVLLRTEWNRHLDFLESKARSPSIPYDYVRRIRDMYLLHSTRNGSAIRLQDPTSSAEGIPVQTVYERYTSAVTAVNNSRTLVPLKKQLMEAARNIKI